MYVYRFLSTGTIEEKVYQRQLSKEGLQNVVNNDAKGGSAVMSTEELRDLFTLRASTASDTHDSICCTSGSEDSQKQSPELQPECCIKAQVLPCHRPLARPSASRDSDSGPLCCTCGNIRRRHGTSKKPVNQ